MSSHGYLEVKNWEEFQHYKDRDPTWIKLYRRLQDNYDWLQLPDASKAHLVGLWILASKHENRIPANPTYIAQRIGATERVNLEVLVQAGFIDYASNAIAGCQQSDGLETEEEGETKTETKTTASPAVAVERRDPEHTLRSCIGLVVEHLYSGNRPPEAAMRSEASIARHLGERHGYDVLARGIQGLARRRDSGDLPNVKPRQVMSLKWINSKKFDINQLAASEDAYYRSDPEPRRGRGKVTDIGDIVASITPRAG